MLSIDQEFEIGTCYCLSIISRAGTNKHQVARNFNSLIRSIVYLDGNILCKSYILLSITTLLLKPICFKIVLDTLLWIAVLVI